jgi:plasmid stabilization system protein ParE
VARVVWSSSALRDVARLHNFLKSKNPEAARRAIRAIRQSMAALAAHPEIGRRAEDMAPEFREWLAPFGDSGYVALYRYDGKEAVILAVRHAREAGY